MEFDADTDMGTWFHIGSDSDVGLIADRGAIADEGAGFDDDTVPDGDVPSDVCSGMDIGVEPDLKALRLEMFGAPFIEFRSEGGETARTVSRSCCAASWTHDSIAR